LAKEWLRDAVGTSQSHQEILALLACKTGGKRVIRVACQMQFPTSVLGDKQRACIGAIHCTGGNTNASKTHLILNSHINGEFAVPHNNPHRLHNRGKSVWIVALSIQPVILIFAKGHEKD
jgi:hypothetical protein